MWMLYHTVNLQERCNLMMYQYNKWQGLVRALKFVDITYWLLKTIKDKIPSFVTYSDLQDPSDIWRKKYFMKYNYFQEFLRPDRSVFLIYNAGKNCQEL